MSCQGGRWCPPLPLLFVLHLFSTQVVQCHDEEASTCLENPNINGEAAFLHQDLYALLHHDDWCVDKLTECTDWAFKGYCLANDGFMQRHCRKSCNVTCGDALQDALNLLGEPQTHLHLPKVQAVIYDTISYIRQEQVTLDDTDEAYPKLFMNEQCRHNHELCSWWTMQGYCKTSPAQMNKMCPASCQTCHLWLKNGINHPSRLDLNELTSMDYWNNLARNADTLLAIDQGNPSTVIKAVPPTRQQITEFRGKMNQDGYIHLKNWTMTFNQNSTAWKDTMLQCHKVLDEISMHRNLPPQFLFVYDQVWQVVNELADLLKPIFGLTLIHDLYVFNIKPGHDGTPMHRDRRLFDWKVQFQKDAPLENQPAYTAVWLALTNANQSTSQMNFLPAYADVDYKTDNPNDLITNHEIPTDEIFAQRYRDIHPISAFAGNVLAWSHRTLHWSSASPPDAPHARQSLRFAMARPNIEGPLITHTDTTTTPPFEARVAIIAYCSIANHYEYNQQEHGMLLKFLHVLTNPKFTNYLSDEALSPTNPRTLGGAFLETLEDFYYEHAVLAKVLSEQIRKLAEYIVFERGLKGSKFIQELVQQP